MPCKRLSLCAANGCGMWSAIGLVLALLLTGAAWRQSRRRPANFYETETYGMTRVTHRRYAAAGCAFAALFLIALAAPILPAVPILAVFAVIAILYGASFVRGASGEDE